MTHEFKEGDRVLFKVPMDTTEYAGTIESITFLPVACNGTIIRYNIEGDHNGYQVVRAGHRIKLISIDLTELLEL